MGFNLITSQIYQTFSNPKTLMKALQMGIITYGAFTMTRLSFTLAAKEIFSRFGKPSLVRETSKPFTHNYFMLPWLYMRKFYSNNIRRYSETNLLKGVILDKKLEDQLREISYAVLNRRKHYAPSKNMLFHGPPGTGKTLFAKKLAMESGLEYAVMTGSDIAPLGNKAV